MNLEFEHYSRPDVQAEISEYCMSRWVATHHIDGSSSLVFRRYLRKKPIRIEGPEEVSRLMELGGRCLRSVYATSNIYNTLKCVADVYDLSNISLCTSTWDIDSSIQNWRETLAVVEEIVSFLQDRGIRRSLYVKWSGNGCHIQINERAFSRGILKKHHPLDLAYAIVEYVNTKLFKRLKELSPCGRVIVENKMDLTRVFTCPLSLHRQLDVVCICLKPESLEDFSPEWIRPSRFKHDSSWRVFLEGEADDLAEDALRIVGGYPLPHRRRKHGRTPLDKQIKKWLQIE